MTMPEKAARAAALPERSRKAETRFLVGLIGSGIQRSLSPALHEVEARQQGLQLHYQLIDLDRIAADAQALPALLSAVRVMGFAGFNVTYPCKQAIVPLLDELSDEARAIGAVNTVVNDAGRLLGHNTDASGWAHGFVRALPDADLGRCVLLGAGGAGAAVAHAVLRLGARSLVVVDREPSRANALAWSLRAQYPRASVEAQTDIDAAMHRATGLIHATPTGMEKLPGLPLAAHHLRADLWVAEVVYFPLETELLRAARAAGCPTIDGGGMAVGQAVGAFELFTHRAADAARMDLHFRRMVAAQAAHG